MATRTPPHRRKLLILGDPALFERVSRAAVPDCDLFLASGPTEADCTLRAHADLSLLLVAPHAAAVKSLLALRAERPALRAVLLTTDRVLSSGAEGMQVGAGVYLLPHDAPPKRLRAAIARALGAGSYRTAEERVHAAARARPGAVAEPGPGPAAWGVEDGLRLERDWMEVIAHDLRTPLGINMGAVSLLLQDAERLDDQARHLLTRLQANGEWMLQLVDGILSLVGLRHGQGAPHRQPTALGALLVGVVERLQPLADLHQVTLRIARRRHSRCHALDRTRVEQVLHNLVVNAINVSPPGGTVQLDVRAGRGRLIFEVRDQGRGMTREESRRAFVKFSSPAEGHGLGLAIAKALVELHGGRIWVESVPGQGSVFCFSIVPGAADTLAGAKGAAQRSRSRTAK